jgi:uncharacterized Zn finger protein
MGDRRIETPRRVRNGLRLKRRDRFEPKGPIACAWVELFERMVSEAARADGLSYAAAGQTVSIELAGGEVTAVVQGRAPRPYRTVLRPRQVDAEQWERLIEDMSSEAVYVAKLLAGEIPAGLEGLFRDNGLELVPSDIGAVITRCTCREPDPCKHAAAVALLLAERLDDDPLFIFALRGMEPDRMLERLRQARALRTHGRAAAHADPLIPESKVVPPPLECCLEEFWRGPGGSGSDAAPPPPTYLPHALLRRLGPSPLSGRFPVVGLLASIYDTVSQSTLELRDHAEHIDQGSD